MEQRPEQPPEGRLIADAADRLDLSIREAARRAGISYGRWRQVVQGYQNVSPGEYAKVHAPAKTLAKMAAAVGVTPEQMESEGRRPDAAQEMRKAADAAPPPPIHLAPHRPPGRYVPSLEELLTPQELADLQPHLSDIQALVRRAAARTGQEDPPGAAVFGEGTREAVGWDLERDAGIWPPEQRAGIMARARAVLAAGKDRRGARGGLTPASLVPVTAGPWDP